MRSLQEVISSPQGSSISQIIAHNKNTKEHMATSVAKIYTHKYEDKHKGMRSLQEVI